MAAGPDVTYNGSADAFVAKVTPTGSGFVYCGYIGGAQNDSANAIALDPNGSVWVVGSTSSDETTFRVFRLYLAGARMGFVNGVYNLHQELLAKPDNGKSGLPLMRSDWYA